MKIGKRKSYALKNINTLPQVFCYKTVFPHFLGLFGRQTLRILEWTCPASVIRERQVCRLRQHVAF